VVYHSTRTHNHQLVSCKHASWRIKRQFLSFGARTNLLYASVSSISHNLTIANHDAAVDLTQLFFLHKLRWSTIKHIASLTFTSNTTPLPDHFAANYTFRSKYTRPHFTCSGLEIVARHNSFDFLYSPYGPDGKCEFPGG
jgi:hypothetical protein